MTRNWIKLYKTDNWILTNYKVKPNEALLVLRSNVYIGWHERKYTERDRNDCLLRPDTQEKANEISYHPIYRKSKFSLHDACSSNLFPDENQMMKLFALDYRFVTVGNYP